jgi:uncharacterized membrane protein
LGSEEAYDLRFAQTDINFGPPGGIIIGTLGVMDGITCQSATVFELAQANASFGFGRLVGGGLRVGSEHIASLVNTLVLAYAGVSLPLFLFFVLNPNSSPAWVMLNSQFVAEELVRTFAGSTGLALAVPITTVIAAWVKTTRPTAADAWGSSVEPSEARARRPPLAGAAPFRRHLSNRVRNGR